MSRVAKAGITLPDNVQIDIMKTAMTVNGPKGTLTQHYNKLVSVERDKDNSNLITFKLDTQNNGILPKLNWMSNLKPI